MDSRGAFGKSWAGCLWTGARPCRWRLVQDAECQAELAEIGAEDFGGVVRGPLVEVLPGVEAEDLAGSGAAGAAGTLGGGGLADAGDAESGKTGPSRPGGLPGEAGIDDGGNPWDGDGRLGYIRGQDEFWLRAGSEDAILLGWGEGAVQRQDEKAVAAGKGLAGPGGAVDFSGARKEDEGVPGVTLAQKERESRRDLRVQWGVRMGKVADR